MRRGRRNACYGRRRTLAAWAEGRALSPHPQGAAPWRWPQPRPQLLTHHDLPRACHFKWRRSFAPSAKEREGAATRGLPAPADLAPHSWQMKYLHKEAERLLTAYLHDVRLRSKNTALRAPLRKEYLPPPPL